MDKKRMILGTRIDTVTDKNWRCLNPGDKFFTINNVSHGGFDSTKVVATVEYFIIAERIDSMHPIKGLFAAAVCRMPDGRQCKRASHEMEFIDDSNR